MNYVESSTLNNTLTWVQSDSQNGVRVIDNATIQYQQLFTSGTGLGQVGSVFYATGFLSSDEVAAFNLHSLTRSIFGTNATINFSGGKVKILNIENLSTGNTFYLVSTGTNPFPLNFLGSSTGVIIYPNSFYNMVNMTGFSIGINRFFYLNNPNNTGCYYRISILGNTL